MGLVIELFWNFYEFFLAYVLFSPPIISLNFLWIFSFVYVFLPSQYINRFDVLYVLDLRHIFNECTWLKVFEVLLIFYHCHIFFKLLIIDLFVYIYIEFQFILQIQKFLFIFVSHLAIPGYLFLNLISLLVVMQSLLLIFLLLRTLTQHVKTCRFLILPNIIFMFILLITNDQINDFLIQFFSLLVVFGFHTALGK